MEKWQKENLAKMLKNAIDVIKTRKQNFSAYICIDCQNSAYTIMDERNFQTIIPIDNTLEGIPDFATKRMVEQADFLAIGKHLKKGTQAEILETVDGIQIAITQANGGKTSFKLTEPVYYERCPEERYKEFRGVGEGKENRLDFTNVKDFARFLKNAHALLKDNDLYRSWATNLHFTTNPDGVPQTDEWKDEVTAEMLDGMYISSIKIKGVRANPSNTGLHLDAIDFLPVAIKLAELCSPKSHVEFNWKVSSEDAQNRDVVVMSVHCGDGQVICYRALQKNDSSVSMPDISHIKGMYDQAESVLYTTAGDLFGYLKDGMTAKKTDFIVGSGHYDFHNRVDNTVSQLYSDDIHFKAEEKTPPSRINAHTLLCFCAMASGDITLKINGNGKADRSAVAWLTSDDGLLDAIMVARTDKEEYYKK